MQLENINLNTAYNLVVQDAMVKNYKVYHFAIKRLKDYSDYQLQKYFKRQPEGEFYIPNMQRID